MKWHAKAQANEVGGHAAIDIKQSPRLSGEKTILNKFTWSVTVLISLYSVSCINFIVKSKGGGGLKREGGTITFFSLQGGRLIRQGGGLIEDLLYLKIFINFTLYHELFHS